MGILDDIFGNSRVETESRTAQHERFPEDTYGPTYPVALHQDELEALKELVEEETSRSTAIEQEPLLNEGMDDQLRVKSSAEELSPFIRELIETWEDQMDADPSAVWWPVAVEWQFETYLQYCELRDEQDEDAFEFPANIDQVRTLFDRCLAAQENDAKLAITQKENIPDEEPDE
ncbi:hypothetical protein JMJ58_07655 [Haloterrigena salifodinae]|uniref:Uncharacterized protein n=1 Tax=Haloterrigena salifodinae TaxID=2675099 RepID=A0A8T8E569_9EURY|nr:hypothetical protein [Haloterrigena salifodinae]QRV16733.1 hypothetical protein JMJ58_07655 [Haloterrigena salifodinae]